MVNNLEFNIIIKVKFILGEINSVNDIIIIMDRRRIKEAIAWVIKYFIEDSDEYIFFVELNKGIIESKLISNPIHILNQEYDEIEIKVPKIIELKKIIL